MQPNKPKKIFEKCIDQNRNKPNTLNKIFQKYIQPTIFPVKYKREVFHNCLVQTGYVSTSKKYIAENVFKTAEKITMFHKCLYQDNFEPNEDINICTNCVDQNKFEVDA